MDEPRDLEARVAALEERVEEVASDAAAARHLAAAGDRDLADLGVRVDAHRAAINGLGVQLNGRLSGVEHRLGGVEHRLGGVEGRLDGVEGRLDGLEQRVDRGFAEARGRFDAAAAGQQTIVRMLTTLIDQPDPPGPSA